MSIIKVSPTVTAGAYTANDCVGGKITLAGAARVAGACTWLQSFTLIDQAAQAAEMVVYLFDADPAAGTYTNDDELDIHDTDMDLCVGAFRVLGGNYMAAKDNTVATVTNIGLRCRPSAGTTLYALIKTTGTPTYAAATDVQLIFGFVRD